MRHIRDLTVSHNQQDVVLLVSLRASHILSHVVNKLNDWSKVRRSTQRHILDGALIGLANAIHAIDLWIKDVAIDGKCVADTMIWDPCAISKDWNLLVRIVVLQDVAHRLDGLQVLVVRHVVLVVQATALVRITIRSSEVNCDREADLASAKYILEEGVSLLELKLVEAKLMRAKSTLVAICDLILLCAFL